MADQDALEDTALELAPHSAPLREEVDVRPAEAPAARVIDELCINTIRTLSMDAVQQADSGHPGTPMALAPVAYTLWQHFLRFDPGIPLAESRPLRAVERPRIDASLRAPASCRSEVRQR